MAGISAWDMYLQQKQKEIEELRPIASKEVPPATWANVLAAQDPPVGCKFCYRPTVKKGRLEFNPTFSAHIDRWCEFCQHLFTEGELE